MRTVYGKSSILGNLRQRPSSNVVTAARQVLTQRWWNTERGNYENVISQYVLDQVSAAIERPEKLATWRYDACNRRTASTSFASSGSMLDSGTVTVAIDSPRALKTSSTQPCSPPEGWGTRSTR
jgi:hypothetical protein